MEQRTEEAIIHVDGHVVGYQFAKKSMGYRTFRKRIAVPEGATTATVHISHLDRDIRIQRLYSSHHWEALP